MIQFVDVEIGYEKPLIKIDNLKLENGKVYVLIGANGSGKTTMLNTIIGKQKLMNGKLLIDNSRISDYSRADLAKKNAFVEAKFDGIEFLSVFEYISLGRSPYTDTFGRLRKSDLQHIENALKFLDLEKYSERYTTQISDGERQLTAIARALAQDTSNIIMDEPTAFLDYANRKRLIHTLSDIAKKYEKCILFSSHDIDLCLEEKLRLLVLDQKTRELKEYNSLSKAEILNIGFDYILEK